MEGCAAGPAGRRFDPHADGRPHAAKPLRHPARSLGQSGRSGCPRGRAVCRPPAGQAGGWGTGASRVPAADGSRSTFQVTNVNAHSLGVEGIDTDTLRKKNVVLIRRNTPLPARYTERFATKSEGQRSIAIKVLEGESPQPGDCIAIGRTVVRDLPGGLPKGWPVEVTFEYGSQRPAGGRGPGAGHASSGPAGVDPRDGAFQRGADALEAAGERGGRVRHVRGGGGGRSAQHSAVHAILAQRHRLRDWLGAAPMPMPASDQPLRPLRDGFAAAQLSPRPCRLRPLPFRSRCSSAGPQRATLGRRVRRCKPQPVPSSACRERQDGRGSAGVEGTGAAVDHADQAGKEAPHSQVGGATDRPCHRAGCCSHSSAT